MANNEWVREVRGKKRKRIHERVSEKKGKRAGPATHRNVPSNDLKSSRYVI